MPEAGQGLHLALEQAQAALVGEAAAITLRATRRRGCSCSASYTMPMPPSPMRRTIR
jgi:hypothetical protein